MGFEHCEVGFGKKYGLGNENGTPHPFRTLFLGPHFTDYTVFALG